MSSAEMSRRLTTQEYLDLERTSDVKHEFYQGQITAMSGARVAHVAIVRNLSRQLDTRFDGSLCQVFTNDLRVLVDPLGFYTYPDLVVVCGELQLAPDQFDSLLNPVVIVEVLSESTEREDRGEKFRRYRELESLRTYVMISQRTMSVEWYDRNAPDDPATWTFHSASRPDDVLRLTALAVPVVIPLSAIYARVDLEPEPPAPEAT
jgi:Uma2 family endonuclease